MKLIVNSKYIASSIKTALESKCLTVECFDNTTLRFSSTVRDIDIGCHFTELGGKEDFNIVLWYRVMRLCKSIPDQPVTIVIYPESIDVYCVHQFKDIVEKH